MRRRGLREGFALVVVLLLAIGLSSMAAGMLMVAEREVRLAAASAELVVARLRAESAARRAFAEWSSASHRDLAAHERRRLIDGTHAAVDVERLADDLFLLRSHAWSGGGGATVHARVGLLVATIGVDAGPGGDSIPPDSLENPTHAPPSASDTTGRDRAFRPPGRWWIPMF